MIETITPNNFATLFGAFKPDGHLMVGLPSKVQARALELALNEGGWPEEALAHFSPGSGVTELEAMIQNAGWLAEVGYEIKLLRRYLDLARQGYHWLLIKVDDADDAAKAAEVAKGQGATLAVHYRMLVSEELI